MGESGSPPPAPAWPAFSVVEVRAPAQSVVEAMGDEGDLVRARLNRGCRCFTACAAGEVVAYGWLSSAPEWIGEVGCSITPGPAEAYVWNCVTVPRLRRQGAFRALLSGVASICLAEGLARLWLGSVPGGALSSVAAAGFTPSLTVSSWTAAGIRVLWARPVPSSAPALSAAARRAVGMGRAPVSLRAARSRRH